MVSFWHVNQSSSNNKTYSYTQLPHDGTSSADYQISHPAKYFCLLTTERVTSLTITGGNEAADGLILNHIALDF